MDQRIDPAINHLINYHQTLIAIGLGVKAPLKNKKILSLQHFRNYVSVKRRQIFTDCMKTSIALSLTLSCMNLTIFNTVHICAELSSLFLIYWFPYSALLSAILLYHKLKEKKNHCCTSDSVFMVIDNYIYGWLSWHSRTPNIMYNNWNRNIFINNKVEYDLYTFQFLSIQNEC